MIQLDWDDDQKTVICYTFLHPWTWEEYHATNAQRDEMFSITDQIIDIILDFTRGSHIPDEAIKHFPKVASWDNPKRGVVIVISANRMLQTLANIMISVYPQAATKVPRLAKDLEDARRIIAEIRRKRDKDRSTL